MARMAAAAPTQVALAGVLGRTQALEGQDEPDDGDQVDEVARSVSVKVSGRIRRRRRLTPASPPLLVRAGLAGRALPALIGLGLEHLEHAVGHHEAAHDVQRGQEHGQEPEHQLRPCRGPRP